jgi:hypothetical protein
LLTAEDPRHAFRDDEAARARLFVEPWRALFAAASLGAVVQGGREDRGIEVAELSEEIDLDIASLERLEADQEDLVALVALPTMERLVRRLQLPASVRLGELVEQAVFDNLREGPPQTETTFARRRRGQRSAAPRPPEEYRRRRAEEYSENLLKRLEESS